MKTANILFCLAVLLVGGAILAGCSGGVSSNQKDGVFIHISSGTEASHRVLMGLNMASLMADDKDVLVYFDIKGIEVVLKDAEEMTHHCFPSLKEQLANLTKKGVQLLACPGCLAHHEKNKLDLAPGVKVAEKDLFFNFTKGRIITLDY